MTRCPVCATVRAEIWTACIHHHITPDELGAAYAVTLTKEFHMRHLTLVHTITLGDIGEETETWEVVDVPTETPAEVPVPSEPVPA